jgi:hypothetical protein
MRLDYDDRGGGKGGFDMRELEGYITVIAGALIDEIEREHPRQMKPDVMIANRLKQFFPLARDEDGGEEDKSLLVWSRILRDAVWLGSAAGRKLDDRTSDTLRISLLEAFDVGRRHAEQHRKVRHSARHV